MREFKVRSVTEQEGERRARVILWAGLISLSEITLFAVFGASSASPQLNTAFVWAAGLLLAAALIAAYFLAFASGLDRVERDSLFILDDQRLIRRRAGFPDIQVQLSEITSLQERGGRLVIEAGKSGQRIILPQNPEGLESLRSELERSTPISIGRKRPILPLTFLIVYIASWSLVLWSNIDSLRWIALAIAAILLIWESAQLFKRFRHTRAHRFVWAVLGLSWAGAILALYWRFFRS